MQAHSATPHLGKKKPFFGYFVVFALMVAICIPMACGINAAGIFYTSLAKEFSTSTGVLSYYTSFLWGAGFLSLPFLGKLLDKVDARICVAGSCLLIALDFVWLSFMSELWQYFVGAFVMGLGVTMLNLMAPSTIIDRWFARRSGFYVGIVMAFSGVGGLIFSTIGGSLILTIGWSHTYLVFAALSAVTVPICWVCIRSYPADKGLEPLGLDEVQREAGCDKETALKAAQGGLTAKQAYRTSSFWIIMALCFLMNFCMYTYYIIPAYVDSRAIAQTFPLMGAIASSCAMGAQTVTKFVMGALSDNKPYGGTIVCFCLGIAGVLTLAFGGGAAIFMYIGAIGYGFFHGTVNVMLPVFSEKSFGTKDYAKIYSRISMASCAAGLTTGLVWGTVIHVTGTYTIVFVGISCLMAVAAGLVVVLRKQQTPTD